MTVCRLRAISVCDRETICRKAESGSTGNPEDDMKTIASIPARSGSKRIPRKNIRMFGGRPIIAYAIEAAIESHLFDHVLVTTDSSEIAEIARNFGAEIPFLRAPELSDDRTPVSEATVDLVEQLDPEGGEIGEVCQLMANCPLRTAQDIIESHRAFVDSKAAAQLSVVKYAWQNPWWALTMEPDGRIEPLFPDRLTQRSQDLPDLYCPTGAIWWSTTSALRAYRTFHIPEKTGWPMPWRHAIDIDTDEDWVLAEALFKMRERKPNSEKASTS